MRLHRIALALFATAIAALALAGCRSGVRPNGHVVQPVYNDGVAVLSTEAAAGLKAAAGKLVYVPVYSLVFHRDRREFLLAVTLSVHNTDPERAVYLRAVDYHDTDGSLLEKVLAAPIRLAPLATAEFIVAEEDTRGGSGANFLVDWFAEEPVSPPLVQTVMIATANQQGISFIADGRNVERPAP